MCASQLEQPVSNLRLLTSKGLWNYPKVALSDQAAYNQLERERGNPLKILFEQVSQVLEAQLKPYAQTLADCFSDVVDIGETTLYKVLWHLPLLRGVPDGDSQVFPEKLAGLYVYDVLLQQWRYIEHRADPDGSGLLHF